MMREQPDSAKTKTTKHERRKKFAHFKDAMHRNFGEVSVSGIGEGKPIICDGCKARVYKAKCGVIKGYLITWCGDCNPDEIAERIINNEKC